MTRRQMHLIGYMIAGPTWHNNGSWRHPESDADRALDPGRYEHFAQILEDGKFDALFFVDVLTLFDTYGGGFAGQVSGPGQMWFLDPLMLLAAMARKTRHIGLAGYAIHRILPSVSHRTHVRHARSHEQRPRGLECCHLGQLARGAKLRHGQADGARRALRPRRRGHGSLRRAVEFLGRRRHRVRPRAWHLRRRIEGPLRRLSGQVCAHARAVAHAAQSARAPRHHASRFI